MSTNAPHQRSARRAARRPTAQIDTAANQPWTYSQGCLCQQAQAIADALEAQIDTSAKLATSGL